MNLAMPAWGLGALIAVVVLVLCIVLLVVGHVLTPVIVFGLLAALAVAHLT